MKASGLMGVWLLLLSNLGAADRPIEQGKVTFKPLDESAESVKRFALKEQTFDYEMKFKRALTVSEFEIHTLTFPSPYKSGFAANDVVHAEYYRPQGKGPFPAVVVLDILDGSLVVSRNISTILASNKIAALIIQLPYYGPRKPPGKNIRLLSVNIEQTEKAITQAVQDIRFGAAWLEARPEVDRNKIGVHGTSLGSFMASLAAASEPRFKKVSLMLGGGGLVEAYQDHPTAMPLLTMLNLVGFNKESLNKLVGPMDPITYADVLKKRQLLMIAAKRDDVVPPKAAQALWEATGKQKIVWYDATHVSAVLHVFDMADKIVKHFQAE